MHTTQPSDLTGRELDMIIGIVNGMTNHQIAEQHYLSINSVKTYIRTAYRKIGITTRSQAVIWGIRNGLLIEAEPVPA